MKDIVKSVVDGIFSFYTIWFGLVVLFILLIINVAEKENADDEQQRVATEVCYNQGLILIDTDAGKYCVDPKSLVKVK